MEKVFFFSFNAMLNEFLSVCLFIYLLPYFASPLRVCVRAGAGMLSGEDRVGCLCPSHYIDSRESLRSHAFDYLTALSFLSRLLSPLLLLPTAPDQTHSDRGRDPEAQKQGREIKTLSSLYWLQVQMTGVRWSSNYLQVDVGQVSGQHGGSGPCSVGKL